MYDWLIFVYVKRVTSPTLPGSILILDSSFYHPLTRNVFLQEISKALGWTPKVVDSCLRENGVLCTVARSWLLFLHDESEWKNFESNIAWGVDELHQTFWLEQFFNGKLCCKIHDLLSVPITFFWIGLLSAQCSVDEFVYVFDARKSDLVESFVFGRGRIQIPSLAWLFDFVIWNEWFTEVS